jgi:hypothetical protein
MPRILTLLVALFLAAATVGSEEPNANVRFGMPAPASANAESSRDAFLITRPRYVLS